MIDATPIFFVLMAAVLTLFLLAVAVLVLTIRALRQLRSRHDSCDRDQERQF